MYYYSDGEQQYGPYTREQLRDYYRQGQLWEEGWIWGEELSDWVSVKVFFNDGAKEKSFPPSVTSSKVSLMDDFVCYYHQETSAETICCNCEKNLCAKCVRRVEGLTYCPDCSPQKDLPGEGDEEEKLEETPTEKEPNEEGKTNRRKSFRISKRLILGGMVGLLLVGLVGGIVWYLLKGEMKLNRESQRTQQIKLRSFGE